MSVQSSPDVAESVPLSAPQQRVPSIVVLQTVLAAASEATVAAELHVSVRTLRRYAAGSVRLNWVTHTRLMRLAEALDAKRAVEARETAERERATAGRKRGPASGSYARVASPVVA